MRPACLVTTTTAALLTGSGGRGSATAKTVRMSEPNRSRVYTWQVCTQLSRWRRFGVDADPAFSGISGARA